MMYGVYKRTHGENVRWYVKATTEGELEDCEYVFTGDSSRTLACDLARTLNDQAGLPALAA